jgi:hypothetical protein
MANTTTWHLPSSGASPVSVAYSAAWNQTGEADSLRMPAKFFEDVLTPLTDKTVTVPITTTQTILCRQYISDPLPPQRLMLNNESTVVRCSESATTVNAQLFVASRVVGADGTVRATLVSGNFGVEFGVTAATVTGEVSVSTSVVTLPGDRLVVEFGTRPVGPTAAGTATFRFGNPGTAEFANTAGLTTDLTPWYRLDQPQGDLFQSRSLRRNTGYRPRPFSPG